MTLIYMIYYEIRNRLHFFIYMLIITALASTIIFGILPILEKSAKDGDLTIKPFAVAFVDNEGSNYTQIAIKQIMESPSIENGMEVFIVSADEANDMINNDEIAAIIGIPEGFTTGMMIGEFKEISVILNPNQSLYAGLVKNGMESGTYLMSAVQNSLYTVYKYIAKLPITEAEINRLFNIEMFSMISYAINRDNIFERNIRTPWQDMQMLDFYSISVILLFMTLYSTGMIYQWHESKDSKLFDRMKLVCKNSSYIVYTYVITASILIFLQGIMLFIPLFLIRHGMSAFKILPFLYLISLSIAALVTLFSALFKKAIVSVFTYLTVTLMLAFSSGTLIPLYFLPDFIPARMRNLSLNYYWQQLLIGAFSKDFDLQKRQLTIVFGSIILILILVRGATNEIIGNGRCSFKKQ
jgi:hypothetical protein